MGVSVHPRSQRLVELWIAQVSNYPRASVRLRHKFASHFVMNGGDLLTLQKILGHSSKIMMMRYSHIAPDHLEQVLDFKPRV